MTLLTKKKTFLPKTLDFFLDLIRHYHETVDFHVFLKRCVGEMGRKTTCKNCKSPDFSSFSAVARQHTRAKPQFLSNHKKEFFAHKIKTFDFKIAKFD